MSLSCSYCSLIFVSKLLLLSMLYYGLYVSFVLAFYLFIYTNVHVILVKCLCYHSLFVSLLCKYLYCGVTFYIYLSLTNSFGLLYSQKIAKRKFETSPFCLITYFGMNNAILCVYSLTFTHALNFLL